MVSLEVLGDKIVRAGLAASVREKGLFGGGFLVSWSREGKKEDRRE